MQAIYKFVAGNSRATPVGVALAAILAAALHATLGQWAAAVFLGTLIVTLAAATAESPN